MNAAPAANPTAYNAEARVRAERDKRMQLRNISPRRAVRVLPFSGSAGCNQHRSESLFERRNGEEDAHRQPTTDGQFAVTLMTSIAEWKAKLKSIHHRYPRTGAGLLLGPGAAEEQPWLRLQ
ncbi:diguanylate cyclase [Anopheles sinensis]|uniref:Diguanylate cyclase n=1 Tax=Anopheles sinensis TaxID=74873 RepID=A0A084W7L6_ANOSI|nr:diguanylate cyclase [Anopheles sinensis]